MMMIIMARARGGIALCAIMIALAAVCQSEDLVVRMPERPPSRLALWIDERPLLLRVDFGDPARVAALPRVFCGEVLGQVEGSECEAKLAEAVDHLRFLEYYERCAGLEAHLVANDVPTSLMEGHTGNHHAKVRFLRSVLDSAPPNPTVCEVGFNAGHSSLNFLTARPDARVFAFDVGNMMPNATDASRYVLFSRLAADFLYAHFPGRFSLTVGDSRLSVPSFTKVLPDVKCDVLFVDGGHSDDIVVRDLENMARLANRTWNRVIVDDLGSDHDFQREIAAAWDAAIAGGLVAEELGRVATSYASCVVAPISRCASPLDELCDCDALPGLDPDAVIPLCCNLWCAAPVGDEVATEGDAVFATRSSAWVDAFYYSASVNDVPWSACPNRPPDMFPLEGEIVVGRYAPVPP